MSELTDFLEAVEADRERVAQFAARLAATRQALETAVSKASQLGSEDVVARLGAIEAGLEQAENGRSMLEAKLEQARVQIDAAIYGNPIVVSGGGSPEPHDVDAVPPHVRHGKNPSGDELVEKPRPKNRFERLQQVAVKEDGTDPAKALAQSISDVTALFNNEASPPPTSTSTETGFVAEVRQPDVVVRAEPMPQVSTGNVAEVVMVLSVVGLRAGQSVASTMGKLTNQFKEHRRK